jgi:hypothetical protein
LRYGVPDRSRRDTLDIVQAVPAFPVEGRGHCHDLTMSFRDVAAWFAIPAFVVSAAAFGFTRYTNRRNLLLRIHELLLDLQNQRGRRLLHLVAAADGWDELNEENRELINHALAMFDVLGFYVARVCEIRRRTRPVGTRRDSGLGKGGAVHPRPPCHGAAPRVALLRTLRRGCTPAVGHCQRRPSHTK